MARLYRHRGAASAVASSRVSRFSLFGNCVIGAARGLTRVSFVCRQVRRDDCDGRSETAVAAGSGNDGRFEADGERGQRADLGVAVGDGAAAQRVRRSRRRIHRQRRVVRPDGGGGRQRLRLRAAHGRRLRRIRHHLRTTAALGDPDAIAGRRQWVGGGDADSTPLFRPLITRVRRRRRAVVDSDAAVGARRRPQAAQLDGHERRSVRPVRQNVAERGHRVLPVTNGRHLDRRVVQRLAVSVSRNFQTRRRQKRRLSNLAVHYCFFFFFILLNLSFFSLPLLISLLRVIFNFFFFFLRIRS